MDKLLIKKLVPEAILPSRAHADDAGLDLYSVKVATIQPGERIAIPTGIACAIAPGFVGLVWDKSGLALNSGITCLAGVIDASYRGEIQVVVLNVNTKPVEIKAGQKIAQLLIQHIMLPEVVEVTDLDTTNRGEGGFGSTGL